MTSAFPLPYLTSAFLPPPLYLHSRLSLLDFCLPATLPLLAHKVELPAWHMAFYLQCQDLKRKLQQIISEKAPKFGDPLFVVSPLTRSLQTFLESNPFPERLAGSMSGECLLYIELCLSVLALKQKQ